MSSITLDLGGTLTREEFRNLANDLARFAGPPASANGASLEDDGRLTLDDADRSHIRRLQQAAAAYGMSSAIYWTSDGEFDEEVTLFDAPSGVSRSFILDGENFLMTIQDALSRPRLREMVAWNAMRARLAITIADTAHQRAAIVASGKTAAERNVSGAGFLPKGDVLDAIIAEISGGLPQE